MSRRLVAQWSFCKIYVSEFSLLLSALYHFNIHSFIYLQIGTEFLVPAAYYCSRCKNKQGLKQTAPSLPEPTCQWGMSPETLHLGSGKGRAEALPRIVSSRPAASVMSMLSSSFRKLGLARKRAKDCASAEWGLSQVQVHSLLTQVFPLPHWLLSDLRSPV